MPSHTITHARSRGPTHAISRNDTPAVTRDAASGIYVPADATEWAAFIAANALTISVPDSVWNCDEPSGALLDSVGSLNLALTGAVGRQQSVTGWTRTGFTLADGVSGYFSVGSGTGPNPATTSSLWVWLTELSVPPAATRIIAAATTNVAQTLTTLTTTPRPRISTTVSATGTQSPVGAVAPWVLQNDRANLVANLYTLQEKVVGTHNPVAVDGAKGVGGIGGLSASMKVVYGFMLSGAAAEISSATLKSVLQAMGYTIPWV